MSPGLPPRLAARLQKRLGTRFEILEELGHGASGVVYKVLNRALERIEALKVLTETPEEDFLARFTQEAKVSASLDHPRIVKVHAFGQAGDFCWYSMQYVSGSSLAEILAVHGALDESALARLAIPLLDALQYSHRQGVIHRDIKPANILVCEEGRPYLTDFGIAKTTDSVHKTRTGILMGTPAYVSPEQALAQPVDPRSDLYSFAVTLYEAASLHLPFAGEASLQTVVMRLKEPPRPLLEAWPSLNPGLAAIVMRALERERDQRWSSAQEMREAFIAFADAAGLAWNRPLENLPDPARVRTALASENRTVVSLDGTWETIEELPDPGPRRWIWIAAAGVALLVLAIPWFARTRSAPSPPALAVSAPEASRSRPVRPAQDPAPRPSPAPARTPPNPPRTPPAAEAPSPGRPMIPPLLEASAAPVLEGIPACTGLTVPLSLRVGTDGRVIACKVLAPVSPACARAAQDAGMKHRFRPAQDAQGRPVEAPVAIAVVFPEAP